MKNLMLALFFNLFVIPLFAQLPPKVTNDDLFGKDCYYLKQAPKDKIIKGILVLIPGYGEHPYAVSAQTTILQEAENNSLAVIMVNLTPNNQNFPIDANNQKHPHSWSIADPVDLINWLLKN
ncbi:MAG TPA: hypothetical protein VL088_15605 [Pedobacter sp.]|nr:hypothetical protein [Pedobacter sp.]